MKNTQLARGGHVIGRGAVTVDGLKSEIPKARAADLRRCLDAQDEAKGGDGVEGGPVSEGGRGASGRSADDVEL